MPRTLGSGSSHSCPSPRVAGSVVVCEWQVAEQEDTDCSCSFIMIPMSPHADASPCPRGACGPTGAAGSGGLAAFVPSAAARKCSLLLGRGLRTSVSTRRLPPSRLCVDGWFAVAVVRGVYVEGLSLGATEPAQEPSFMSPNTSAQRPSLPSPEGQRLPRLCLGVWSERAKRRE